MMSLRRTVGIAFAALAVQTAVADNSQVDEARAVFDGVKVSAMRGGTWKVVYSSAEGPEGKALEVLTERLGPTLLREEGLSTAMVLPLEKAGGSPTLPPCPIIGGGPFDQYEIPHSRRSQRL